jgi:hypothetical protein
MQWLTLAWALTFGFMPSQNDSFFTPEGRRVGIEHENAIVVDLELDATFMEHVHFFGGVKTYAVQSPESMLLSPYRADYTFGVFGRIGPLDIGVSHECDHGVESGPVAETWYGNTETTLFFRLSSRGAAP